MFSRSRGTLKSNKFVNEAIANSLDKPSLIGLDSDEKKLEEQDSINVNSTLTSPNMITEIPTEIYVDPFFGNEKNKRESSVVIRNHDNEVDNIKLPTLDSSIVNRNSY